MNTFPRHFNNLKTLIHKISSTEAEQRISGREVVENTARVAELNKKNIFIDNLLRSSRDTAIIATDLELVITYFNPVAEKLFGFSADTLIGKRVPEIHPDIKDKADRFQKIITQVLSEGSYTLTMELNRGDSAHLIEATLTPIKDNQNGRPCGLMLMARDVTKQKEDAKRQKTMFSKIQQLGQAVEQSSNSIIITNTQGKIEYVNKTFVTVTGYSANEAIGQTPAILKSGQTPDAVYKNMWSTITSGREWSGEFVNKKKNGSLYEEHIVISPLRNEDGTITHFVATKENISDLKIARLQAESANQAKSAFLANMSHEIRTPMNAIIGMTELVLDTELGQDQRKYLNTVNSSACHLLSIINDILDYSKIKAEQLSLEKHPFRPCTILDEVISTLSVHAREKGLVLSSMVGSNVDKNVSYQGDSLRLQQVLLNLVGNAIKFTDTGSVTLELDIRASDRDDLSLLEFRVRDTGIGIPLEQQQDIFERFSQSDTTITRKFGGTGLGLAISNRLIQLMGDTIHVKSHPGEGSTFFFRLSLQKSLKIQGVKDTNSKHFPPPPTQQPRILSILLVEDNQANQDLAQILLEFQGHTVIIANNGLEALQYLSKQKYDIVFMDIQMPVMDGITATRCIRDFELGTTDNIPEWNVNSQQLAKQLGGHHLYIVATTANAMAEDRLHCLDAGMDEYLSKPYKRQSLEKILQTFENQNSDQNKQEATVVSVEKVYEHLRNIYGLDQEDIENIVDTYAKSLMENLEKLQHAVTNRENEAGSFHAHALKGALLNIGLQKQADTASLLEKELPRKDMGQYETIIKDFTAELQPITDLAKK